MRARWVVVALLSAGCAPEDTGSSSPPDASSGVDASDVVDVSVALDAPADAREESVNDVAAEAALDASVDASPLDAERDVPPRADVWTLR